MSLSLVPDDEERGNSIEISCDLESTIVFGRNEIDKEDKKLSKLVARLEPRDAKSAKITRVGRTGMHVIPKGETGTLSMCKEGEENGREKSTEVMWLGDQVVVLGSRRHTYVLLPQGKTWFQWAEQHREEEELRLLELREIGGQTMTEEELARKETLKIKIQRWKEEEEARLQDSRRRQEEGEKERQDTSGGQKIDEERRSNRDGMLSASDQAGLPPPPASSPHALSGCQAMALAYDPRRRPARVRREAKRQDGGGKQTNLTDGQGEEEEEDEDEDGKACRKEVEAQRKR
eukprot:764125-Hanusia_phi.AAC.1